MTILYIVTVLLQIALELPATPGALHALTLTSRRLHGIAQAPIVWARVFYAVPGHRLRADVAHRVVATATPPGRWGHSGWVAGDAAPAPAWSWREWLARFPLALPARLRALLTGESEAAPAATGVGPAASGLDANADAETIPVHYPTLYRSRLAIGAEMRAQGPHARFDAEPDDEPTEDDVPVAPRHVWRMDAHAGYVYAVVLRSGWAITGSRDTSFKVWCMPPLGTHMESEYGPVLAYTEEAAHEGSVLALDFERTGGTGFLVTGSSDATACCWRLDFGAGAQDARGDVAGVSATKVATLRGHARRVAAVALTPRFVVTGSHDNTIRIYARDSVADDAAPLHVLATHADPLSAMCLDPSGGERLATAGIDGKWAILDLATGAEVAAGTGGPKYTCVQWAGDGTVACGTVDGQVLLFGEDGSPQLTIPGELRRPVRAVLVDTAARIILSAGHDQRAHVWDLGGRRLRTYDFQTHTVYAMSRDGLRLACAAGTSVWFITYGVGLPYAGLFA
ncbi:hypothetical protein Q8F55_000827 [Vanrija albida]|uniref:F-box domain-containing protein n=1 Tax=Vanrija albida TaxID=181172 RepID=A0ABR3QED4_9TREE